MTSPSPPKKISPEIIEIARTTGVLDILGSNPALRQNKEIRKYYMASAVLGAKKLEEFRIIANEFNKAGIPFAPLKGMAYGLMFENGGPTRSMCDIDILVPPWFFKKACHTLATLGYKGNYDIRSFISPGHNEIALTKKDSNIDLHKKFSPPITLNFDYKEIWDRVITIEKEGIKFFRLSEEDNFLFHVIHIANHRFLNTLRGFFEMRTIIIKDKPDFRVCSLRAKEWGCQNIVWCVIRIFEELFPELIPLEIIHLFEPPEYIKKIFNEILFDYFVQSLTAAHKNSNRIEPLINFVFFDSKSRFIYYYGWKTFAKIIRFFFLKTKSIFS